MSMNALQLEQVSFAYRKNEKVLSDVNISVEKGTVYGFLGANGAGKTTSIRLILGLLKAQKGSIKLFEQNIDAAYPKGLKQVGSLVESPSLYGHLSARDNLRIWCKNFKCSKSRIEQVLEEVNLGNTGRKNTSTFSTGMKQRLGLAISLLHDPDFLILDEPINGLDPMGIIEFRKIIQAQKANGKTILLSSHILSEVEKMVDRIGILKDGKIVFEGSILELDQLRQKDIQLKIKVDDVSKASEIIGNSNIEEVDRNYIYCTIKNESEIPQLIVRLLEAQVLVYEFSQSSSDLEQMFINLAKS